MKILVADDHPLVLSGLRALVAQLAPAVEVLAGRSLQDVLEQISVHPDLDLVLIDFRMPGMAGVSSVRQVAELAPTVPVVVVSAFDAETLAEDLAEAGAAGLVPKSMSEPGIAAALRRVLSGGRYFPPAPLAAIAAAGERAAEGDASGRGAVLAALTPREREVVEQLGAGRSNKDIARRLGCSDATVKVHVKAILRKLGVGSRAAVIAMLHGRG